MQTGRIEYEPRYGDGFCYEGQESSVIFGGKCPPNCAGNRPILRNKARWMPVWLWRWMVRQVIRVGAE